MRRGPHGVARGTHAGMAAGVLSAGPLVVGKGVGSLTREACV